MIWSRKIYCCGRKEALQSRWSILDPVVSSRSEVIIKLPDWIYKLPSISFLTSHFYFIKFTHISRADFIVRPRLYWAYRTQLQLTFGPSAVFWSSFSQAIPYSLARMKPSSWPWSWKSLTYHRPMYCPRPVDESCSLTRRTCRAISTPSCLRSVVLAPGLLLKSSKLLIQTLLISCQGVLSKWSI